MDLLWSVIVGSPHDALDGPGASGELDRAAARRREAGLQVESDALADVVADAGEVGGRRAGAAEERIPVVVEVPEHGGDVDGAHRHPRYAGPLEQRAQRLG